MWLYGPRCWVGSGDALGLVNSIEITARSWGCKAVPLHMTERITTSRNHGEGEDLREKNKHLCIKTPSFSCKESTQKRWKSSRNFCATKRRRSGDIAFEEAALSWRCRVFVGPVAVVFWNERQPYNHAVTINTDLYWILLILRLWLLIQQGENNSMWTASMQHVVLKPMADLWVLHQALERSLKSHFKIWLHPNKSTQLTVTKGSIISRISFLFWGFPPPTRFCTY